MRNAQRIVGKIAVLSGLLDHYALQPPSAVPAHRPTSREDEVSRATRLKNEEMGLQQKAHGAHYQTSVRDDRELAVRASRSHQSLNHCHIGATHQPRTGY
jgi:hypothetical protein